MITVTLQDGRTMQVDGIDENGCFILGTPGPEIINLPKSMTQIGCHAMTLRDWFAGQALQGIADHARPGSDLYAMANHAYAMADAMLKSRTK